MPSWTSDSLSVLKIVTPKHKKPLSLAVASRQRQYHLHRRLAVCTFYLCSAALLFSYCFILHLSSILCVLYVSLPNFSPFFCVVEWFSLTRISEYNFNYVWDAGRLWFRITPFFEVSPTICHCLIFRSQVKAVTVLGPRNCIGVAERRCCGEDALWKDHASAWDIWLY